ARREIKRVQLSRPRGPQRFVKAHHRALKVLEHFLDAAAVRTFFRADFELHWLDRPALAVLRITIVLAPHRHPSKGQSPLARKSPRLFCEEVRFLARQEWR